MDLWGGYCVFKRFYNEQSQTPAEDVIRGIDWLGNGGFVRNLIEKARDHRDSRLDTNELDALLAADSFDAADEDLMRRFRELIPEDFAEGLRLALRRPNGSAKAASWSAERRRELTNLGDAPACRRRV